MKKESLVPKRRFKEFEGAGDWEQRKLGKLGSLKNGMNFSKEAMGVGFPFVNLQNIFEKNQIDCDNLGKAEASAKQLKDYNLIAGDVLFVRSSVKLEGVGEAALVPENLDNTTYSGFIIRFRDEVGMDAGFKRFVFSTSEIRQQIISQATDSANKNISQGVLANLEILLPTKSEQERLGAFFSNLDNLITLHQRKLNKMEALKKAYLSEMFPAEGERKPKRRFEGFTDDWEQRKVSDILELLTDFDANGSFTDMANNVSTYDGEGYAWYVRMTDLKKQSELSKLKYVDKESYDFLKKTELHGGELLMAKRGEIGNVYIFKARTLFATLAPNMYLLKLNKKTVPEFMYGFFQADIGKNQLLKLNASTTMGALYKDDVKNIDVKIPSFEEQSKIAEFFSRLDTLITLHQRKLEKLQNLKKAYLEEMFV